MGQYLKGNNMAPKKNHTGSNAHAQIANNYNSYLS